MPQIDLPLAVELLVVLLLMATMDASFHRAGAAEPLRQEPERGRGKRRLVVTTRSMLELFQKEFRTRFSIPLEQLDSVGIQRIRERIPSNQNPFHYNEKASRSTRSKTTAITALATRTPAETSS
jgi:hypothetical protein